MTSSRPSREWPAPSDLRTRTPLVLKHRSDTPLIADLDIFGGLHRSVTFRNAPRGSLRLVFLQRVSRTSLSRELSKRGASSVPLGLQPLPPLRKAGPSASKHQRTRLLRSRDGACVLNFNLLRLTSHVCSCLTGSKSPAFTPISTRHLKYGGRQCTWHALRIMRIRKGNTIDAIKMFDSRILESSMRQDNVERLPVAASSSTSYTIFTSDTHSLTIRFRI